MSIKRMERTGVTSVTTRERRCAGRSCTPFGCKPGHACNRYLRDWRSSLRRPSNPHIYLKRVKIMDAFYGLTGWHSENALRLAQVMADRTARRASG